MKKFFIFLTALVLLSSCSQNEDLVVANESSKTESLKYVLPDGKSVMVTFDKETGIPFNNSDFAYFKTFVDKNKDYATFIDAEGTMKLLKNKNELNNLISKESESVSGKGVIGLNCSGYVNLYSDLNYSVPVVNYITTNKKGLVAVNRVHPSQIIDAFSLQAMYQGYISFNSSIVNTSSIKMKNCLIDLTFQKPYFSSGGVKPPGDYLNKNPKLFYSIFSIAETNVPPYYFYNGKLEYMTGSLIQIIYNGNCYTTS